MSRNQPGGRAPQRRHPAEHDPYAAAPQWGRPQPGGHGNGAQHDPQQTYAPQGYDQYAAHGSQHGSQGNGYYLPQGQEPDPNYSYPPQTAPAPAFERFPPPAAPGLGHAPAGQAPAQWNQQHDARNYDLGAYMPAGGQAFQQGEAAHPHTQDPHDEFGAHQVGYGDSDADYDEAFGEEDAPSRGRRGLIIVGALVGAIGLGGALAYTYKSFIAPAPGRTPLVRATDPAANKVKPVAPGGREFAHTDKKLINRLGEDGGQKASEGQDDRTSDDPNAPRKVHVIPIVPGGPASGTAAAGSAPVMPMAGITLDNMGGPAGPPPSAQRVQIPPSQSGPPVKAVQAPAPPSQPPVKIASVTGGPAPSAEPPAPKVELPTPKKGPAVSSAPPVTSAPAPSKKPVPKNHEKAPAPAASASSGFVAVLSSKKSRMDALKAFADLQQKYGDVLATKTPDVQEANLGDKGIWYRAVVGPPGSRDAAAGICSHLKTAGYTGCWVTAY